MAKVQFLEQGAYAVLWLPNWFHFGEKMVRMQWLGSFGILEQVLKSARSEFLRVWSSVVQCVSRMLVVFQVMENIMKSLLLEGC